MSALEINFKNHREIDKKRWDECVRQSSKPLIYATSDYLDIVSPQWDALILEDYKAVFPICVKRKFGLNYVGQPLFAQQLGVFAKPDVDVHIDDFLFRLPRKYIKIHMRLNPTGIAEAQTRRFGVRLNYTLDITEESMAAYNQNTKRNIKKFDNSGLMVEEFSDTQDFMRLSRRQAAYELKEEEWLRMHALIDHLVKNKKAILLGVKINGHLEAGICLGLYEDKLYYLFSASSEKAKENRCAFGLVHHIINKQHWNSKILDFEGSMNENIARFFQGFGGREEHYYDYTKGLVF